MSIATKKLELIDRLMKVGEEETLKKVEELLLQIEMQARVDESMEDVAKGNVVSLDEFTQRNKEWLRAKHTK